MGMTNEVSIPHQAKAPVAGPVPPGPAARRPMARRQAAWAGCFAVGMAVAVAGSLMTGAVKEKGFTKLVVRDEGVAAQAASNEAGAGHDHGGGHGNYGGQGASPPGSGKKGPESVTIDVAKLGPLKRLVQPWVQRVAVVVDNKLREPRRLAVAVAGCDGLRWRSHVYDVSWDAGASAFRTPVPAGKSFSVSLQTRVPDHLRRQPVICKGRVEARDAVTGEVLAATPLEILNSRAGVPDATKGGKM